MSPREIAHLSNGVPVLLSDTGELLAAQPFSSEAEQAVVTTLSGTNIPTIEFLSRRPNSATTTTAVHPGAVGPETGRKVDPSMLRTGCRSSVSTRDMLTNQRRPSERFIATRKNEVNAIVDELLSVDGFQIQRTASRRQQKPTVTM